MALAPYSDAPHMTRGILDFALKYDLNILPVVLPEGENKSTFKVNKKAYTGEGGAV